MTSDIDEEYEEIAAWLEYCQGNDRETAERLARKICDEKRAQGLQT